MTETLADADVGRAMTENGAREGAPGDQSDQALVTRMGRGDRDALDELFRDHAARLLLLGARLLSASDAEEVLHEVFLEAWRRARSYNHERGSVRAWLSVRMRSRCLDRLKSNRRHSFVSLESETLAPSSDENIEHHADILVMKRALEALVDEQREVLILTYFRGLSMSETSDALGIPLGTVKSRARTAMQQLREQMADSKGATGD